MHDSRFDLNLLRVFDAIYHGGSVTRASEVLNLSQPAISHALKRLRDQIGDPLFVRLGQGLTPTPAAHKLIEPVRNALREIELAMNNIETFDVSTANMCFRVGFNALMEESLFPAIVDTIMAQAPAIRVESVRYDRQEMAMMLASAQLDAIIDVKMPVGDSILSRKISSQSILGIARANHPLFASDRAALSLEEYMALRHVTVSTRPRGASFEDAILARSTALHRKIGARCQSISTALQLVARTDMVATVPLPAVGQGNPETNLRTFELPLDLPAINSYLYWHSSSDADQAHTWLRETIFDALK